MLKLISLEPTLEMKLDGGRRLLSFQDESTDDSFSPLQWAAVKNEAERVWRSMWLSAPEPTLSREELYAAVREIAARIEKCGASPELTHAVTLCSDLASAIGNQWNNPDDSAADRVRKDIP